MNRYALQRRLKIILLIFVSIFLVLFIWTTQEQKSFLTSTISSRTIIVIRTSYHCQPRLNYLLQSWIPTDISEQSNLYILTDKISKYPNQTILNSFKNLIETSCSQTHKPFDLCCKTAHEFELFDNLSKINSNLDWMCRFDDDQYVNLKNLYKFLSKIDPSKPYYIGRTSTSSPSRISKHNRTYTFATYGAGVCFSRLLLEKLRPHVNKTILPYSCVKRGIADDGYIGYLIEFILNIPLTSYQELFHSHLENVDISLRYFDIGYLQKAITLGFAWDRYTLSWLPIIHQLILLIDNGDKTAANLLWTSLQNHEKEHPEDLKNKYDQSCTSYRRKKQN
jgi:hypothetical protein